MSQRPDKSRSSGAANTSVLSISLDEQIVTEGGWSRQRQREYAEHFDEYVVLVKTEGSRGEKVSDGPLTAIPTHSVNRYAFLFDAYRAAVEQHRDKEFDVVTVQDPFVIGLLGLVLKWRLNAQLHTQVHIDFFDNPDWYRSKTSRRLFGRIGRLILRHSDTVRVGTEYERRKLKSILSSDIRVHHAPVQMDLENLTADSTESERSALKSRFELDSRPVVLFVGRFVPQKNLERFVTIAEGVINDCEEDPVFLMVGDGPERSTIRSIVGERGISDHFRFPGRIEQKWLSVCYDVADVCLLTSNFEGTCRVLAEAGMNDVPVIATPFAGSHDYIVDGETGFVREENAELVNAVCSLLVAPERTREMGNRASNFLAEQFDNGKLVQRYVTFLTE